jgi:predicted dehydrogenase
VQEVGSSNLPGPTNFFKNLAAMSKQVRLGIIGLGVMGRTHAANILAGKVPRLQLTAAAETNPEKLALIPGVKAFASLDEMIASGLIDAVLIATPHFQHTSMGIQALQAGLHVLVEKPISVHKADAERLIAAHTRPNQVFAAMFNLRTDPRYQRLHELIHSGQLGEVRRINWINTTWFRTEHYFASGTWRATYAGEGGGLLLNQCPHNLDLLQWLFGLPTRVRAFCRFGEYHDIEVEDDVTAYLEFPNGATCVFISSTGEAPGTNRLEITAERGRIVFENDQIALALNDTPMTEFSRTAQASFSMPVVTKSVLEISDRGSQHLGVLKNFTDAILDGTPLIVGAAEGIRSLELANAMILSTWKDATVELPIDGREYEALLQKKIAGSKPKSRTRTFTSNEDFAKSFGR